ncbi:MAG TPA: GNAT family N-acetyltransferase [Acetobacteraceae bacterium]
MALIRSGRDADSPGVIALISRCWADYNYILDVEGDAPELLAPAADYAAQGGALWIAEDAGAVTGMVAAVPRGAGAWEICRVYVHPGRHGTGLAHRLLDTAEAHALAAGAARLLLWTDTQFDRAHRFYEKRSYVRSGPIRILETDPDILEFGYAKPVDGVAVLDAAAAASAVLRLSGILVACADGGGSASHLPPLAPAAAQEHMRTVASGVAQGRCLLLGAWSRGVLAGTVRMGLDVPSSQRHRAEVADLLVHPDFRQRGLATGLMRGLETEAARSGRTLLTLNAEADGAAVRLCARLGWTVAGNIPGYAVGLGGLPVAAAILFKSVDGGGT